MESKIRKAVSIVFIYKNEIFAIERQNHLRAFPGYTAFPGGKVDKSDQGESEEETLLNALIREVKEELDIDIPQLQSEKKIKEIKQIALATSPEYNPVRFETYFYKVVLNKKIKFNLDENEVRDGKWDLAFRFLADYNNGNRLMVPPVRMIIDKLSEDIKFSEFFSFDSIRSSGTPFIENIKGVIQYMPKSNTLPPAERTNAFVIGDETKVLIDPSPCSLEEYREFVSSIAQYRFDKIFITHHHPDHHQFSPEIAKYLNIPIFISEDSYHRILKKHGDDYFDDCEINIAKEGDAITKWKGFDVLVYETPGHDEGQLGLAPKNMEWFIAGDLFQGIGTVVVGNEEGDMAKYMNSLQKVIDLKPACVFPSHGIALGGTFILEKTLEHRKLREEQVLELLGKGHSEEEILSTIYHDIPRKLHPYAMANIKSHIQKLKKESRI